MTDQAVMTQDKPIMTMYMLQFGEVPHETCTTKGRSAQSAKKSAETATRGKARGWGMGSASNEANEADSESTSDKLPTFVDGVDTDTLAAAFATLDWSLQTQEDLEGIKKLPFTLDNQLVEAFPGRRLVQVKDLRQEQPSPAIYYRLAATLTKDFVNRDLVLKSDAPKNLKQLPEQLQQVHQKCKTETPAMCTFMLLTEEQLHELIQENMLGQAMIQQHAHTQRTWFMNFKDDEYWLQTNATRADWMQKRVWDSKNTFMFGQEISAKLTAAPATTAGDGTAPATTAGDGTAPATTAGDGTHVLRVDTRLTPRAGTAPSSTWKYETDPGQKQAMPAVNKMTQIFILRFEIYAGPIPPTSLNIDDNCPICENKKTEFVAAACGHAFCSTCVETVKDKSRTVKCPFCRATHSRDDMVSVHFPAETRLPAENEDAEQGASGSSVPCFRPTKRTCIVDGIDVSALVQRTLRQQEKEALERARANEYAHVGPTSYAVHQLWREEAASSSAAASSAAASESSGGAAGASALPGDSREGDTRENPMVLGSP